MIKTSRESIRTVFHSLFVSRPWAITLFLVWAACSVALGQSSLEQLRQNLTDGYYAIAARVSGPVSIKEDPTNPEAYFLYSYALYYTEDFPGAREQFEQARALSSGELSPDFVHLDGLITAGQGDLKGAMTLLETAFLRSQDYTTAMDWGRTAWLAGEFDKALNAYEAAGQTEQGQKEIWPSLNQGRLQQAKGDPEAAIAAYKLALAVFDANDPGTEQQAPPGVVEANFHLGEIYESLGDIPLAKSYYDAAIGYDRNYTPAKNALDRLLRSPSPQN
jgi:tetratricopeptide (TPR) repeat protein